MIKMVTFDRDGEIFEVDMGEDLRKVFLCPKKIYTQAFIKKFFDNLDTSKVVMLPPDVDVIIVREDGSEEKY